MLGLNKSRGLAQISLLENDKRQFANPISKNTFESLPKIYGRPIKKKYLMKYQFEYQRGLHGDDQNRKGYSLHRCGYQDNVGRSSTMRTIHDHQESESTMKRNKTEIKTSDKQIIKKLSLPKPEFCTKKYCACHKIHELNLNQQKSPKKIILGKKLPILEEKMPDETQSQHKVMRIKTEVDAKPTVSLLDLLRSTQRDGIKKLNTIERSQRQQNDVQVQTNADEYQFGSKGINIDNNQRGPQTQRSNKLQHQQSNNEQLKNNKARSMSLQVQKALKHNKIDDDDSSQGQSRIKNTRKPLNYESDDSESVSSVSSASFSKYIFQNDGNKNTAFKNIDSHMKKSRVEKKNEISINNKYVYQKKNGLFIIPQEEQYVHYLKDYQPMGEKFKIKNLIKKQNFKVVKSQEGVYFGQIENNSKNGSALMISERLIFQGKYRNNIKTYGCEKNIDGIYRGGFVNGLREGYGTFQWNNGEVFEGQWKNGTKNGFGTWKSPKGDFYEGEWLLNRQHGKGTFKHRLSTYRGEFLNFLKHGQGEQIFSNGDRYKGEYKEGRPHGKGRYEWGDGGYYEGQFSNGMREGKGKWYYLNGTVYEGQFKKDFKHGYGIQKYKSGEYYEGQFREGQKFEGTLYDLNGNAISIRS